MKASLLTDQELEDLMTRAVAKGRQMDLEDPNTMLSEQDTLVLIAKLLDKPAVKPSILNTYRKEGLAFKQGWPTKYRRGDVIDFVRNREFRKRSSNL